MGEVATDLIQCIINGIAMGCIYGLVALGFVLIYKATEVVNFAQGELMMIGAFVAYTFVAILGLAYWLAFLFSVAFMWIFGVIFDRLVLRPLVGEGVFAIVMVTIGFGTLAKSVVSMIPGWGTESFTFITLALSHHF
jgi:branched-chain amino acid transport system permease protein